MTAAALSAPIPPLRAVAHFDRGAGRPVVFLHGWATHGGFFRFQEPLAGPDRRLIALDLPGHGAARAEGRPVVFADLAPAVADWLEGAGLDGVVLVGWSMGASVAFDLIARFGLDRIAGLVVIDMTARILDAPGWTHGLAGGLTPAQVERASAAMRANWPRQAERVVERLFAPGRRTDTADLAGFIEAIEAADGAAMASLWSTLATTDFRSLLPRIDRPALVVTGAESRLYRPDVGVAMAQALARGRHVAIEGAGHAPQIEAPAAFNRVLADFIASLNDQDQQP
ncbi:alpha/beta fold hydrolase [Prosthecodimorpha staleyi]|uniref:Alpha/beta hydrolase n=1 Tax=Prosthecodimorpha staleyi TaxID=2840188 RepID=A0A947D3K9_9HYPH|nr:alpha/beta hydrolase [Prosthecodimorpha staleyi]MBT9290368.1 alpha/beta hydrolase [Prosthecodimorpha staleyi]